MSDAREALLARVVDHVAETGLSDASLREIAAGVGTSHRMLHFHFGGRDGLVAAIVGSIEQQQREALGALAEGATSPAEVIRAQWAELNQPQVRPFVRLFFEVLALALHGRPGTEGFLDQLTSPWLEVAADIAERLDVDLDPAELRLGVAVVRGLLVDSLASDDPVAAGESLDRFLAMWDLTRATRPAA